MDTAVAARGASSETIEALRKGKRVSVQVDLDVAEGVAAVAQRERRSVSSAINVLLAEALEARAARTRRLLVEAQQGRRDEHDGLS